MIRGAEQLVEIRRNGRKPSTVLLTVGPWDAGMAASWASNDPGKGYLHERSDTPLSGLDLRCVVGIGVIVDADSFKAARDFGRACVDAGALWVVAGAVEGREVLVLDSRRDEL